MAFWRALASGLLLVAALAGPAAAQAAPELSNPFLSAEGFAALRGPTADAGVRYVYERTRSGVPGHDDGTDRVEIEVAADWALFRAPDYVVLHDFRLGRDFMLQGESFIAQNQAASVGFRVMERQNRAYLTQMLTAAGVKAGETPSGCDSDTELGVAIANLPDSESAEIRERGRTITLTCGVRSIGRIEQGRGADAPAALWPTITRNMSVHPMLQARGLRRGPAPEAIEADFSGAMGGRARVQWRLVSATDAATPYPLAQLRNGTAEWISAETWGGAGELALAAVEGRAQGGPPTLESWDRELDALAQRDPEAAALKLFAGVTMFPALLGQCAAGAALTACTILRDLPNIMQGAPAMRALMITVVGEQRGDLAGVVEAMQAAKASPNGGDGALKASFALALLSANQAFLTAARDAGLETDVQALQAAALAAYPYTPAYWSDVGDRFAAGYRYDLAFAFYDAAAALPVAGARDPGVPLDAKRAFTREMRSDFPDFFLAP